MSKMLVCVDAPARPGQQGFRAALVLVDGVCTRAAPILYKLAIGRTGEELVQIFKVKGWHAYVPADP